MARIDHNRFKKIVKENKTHKKVKAEYSVFNEDSAKIIQIDTFGDDDREFPNKISQTIQIDKETAIIIKKIINDEFGEIV